MDDNQSVLRCVSAVGLVSRAPIGGQYPLRISFDENVDPPFNGIYSSLDVKFKRVYVW